MLKITFTQIANYLMVRKYRNKLLLIFIFVSILTVLLSTPAKASVVDDFMNGIKKFMSGDNKATNKNNKKVSVESQIDLVPTGDLDKNNEIDSGDTVRFKYIINNPTPETLSFVTLKTKINRKMINFIRNESGIANLIDNDNTLDIPYLTLYPYQQVEITFDADINFSSSEDIVLSTEPELVDKEQKSIVNSTKQEVQARKVDKEKILQLNGQKIKELKDN